MAVPPPVLKRLMEENNIEENNINNNWSKPIKNYRYRLVLEVYEDEPFTIPNDKFVIDTLSVFRDKEVVNEALKRSFELLLNRFNLQEKADE